MKIWLGSYPRSGNTFFRIVLSEVYGIESSTFHNETTYPVDADYDQFPIVKTHLLPEQLAPDDPDIPAVYLVRDGRDALVSIAHHKADLIEPGTNFFDNLEESIRAADGSYFGGWGNHVRAWQKRAALIIRFEDLIRDPIASAERLREIMDLPPPKREALPGFNDLKEKNFKYGSGKLHGFDREKTDRTRKAWFRRGKVGAWLDEMPPAMEREFYSRYGDVLLEHGYDSRFRRGLRGSIRWAGEKILGQPPKVEVERGPGPRKVLIEATKLLDDKMDGTRRYVLSLLQGLLPIAEENRRDWQFDIYLAGLGGLICDVLTVQEYIESGGWDKNLLPLGQPRRGIMPALGRGMDKTGRAILRYTLPLRVRDFIRSVYSWIKRPADDFFDRYDLIHLTLPNTFAPFARSKARFITTVHDLCHVICPEYQRADNIATLQKGLGFAVSRGSFFLSVSTATQRDLFAHYQVDPAKATVVLEACDRSRFRVISETEVIDRVRGKYGIPAGPYLLSLATLEPRKNFANTLRAYSALVAEMETPPPVLVVAGRKGWHFDQIFAGEDIAADRVIFTGYVQDDDLAALYSGAKVFAYVSHYEGFGLPPLEAMSCGVPVLYGDNSSMPEVVGDAGLGVDSHDVEAIKVGLYRLLTEEEFRRGAANRALARAETFSHSRVTRETVGFYTQAIGPRAEGEEPTE